MKIGIDAKWYFTGPPSTQRLLQNLLPRIFKIYPQYEWIIFLDKQDKACDFPFKQPNIKIKYVWANNNLLSNLFILPCYLRKEKVDVMVFQTFPAKMKKTRSVAFIHDVLFRDFPQFFTWKEKLYFFPLSWLAPKADRLMVTTEFVANDVIKFNYAKTKTRIDILPLGVDTEFSPIENQSSESLRSIKEKFNLPDPFILFAGRLNKRKNIESLLKAMSLIRDKNIKLVIVGKEDGKKPVIDKTISDLGLKERIVRTGYVTNQELSAIYGLAKVFCFPSFAEGFGLPPLEAMAAGVPVIVSNTTALPETCGNAAVYIDPADPESIVIALNDLLSNEDKWMEKRKAGLEQAAKYNWEVTAELFMLSIINAGKINLHESHF